MIRRISLTDQILMGHTFSLSLCYSIMIHTPHEAEIIHYSSQLGFLSEYQYPPFLFLVIQIFAFSSLAKALKYLPTAAIIDLY